MTALAFFVPGKPQTAGSKTAVPMGSRMGVIEAGTKESRARKKTWRGDLRDGALRAMEQLPVADLTELLDAPLAVTMVIVRRRPATHIRANGTVKDWAAPLLPVQRPDTVKIVRAAADALTGVLWDDDSQIVRHQLHKAFGDQAGLRAVSEGLFVAVDLAALYSLTRLSDMGLSPADTRLEAAA